MSADRKYFTSLDGEEWALYIFDVTNEVRILSGLAPRVLVADGFLGTEGLWLHQGADNVPPQVMAEFAQLNLKPIE